MRSCNATSQKQGFRALQASEDIRGRLSFTVVSMVHVWKRLRIPGSDNFPVRRRQSAFLKLYRWVSENVKGDVVTLFVESFENVRSAFTHTALFGNVTAFFHLEVICERDPLSKRWQISSGSSLASDLVTLPDYVCNDVMCEQSCKIKGLSMCKIKSSSQS